MNDLTELQAAWQNRIDAAATKGVGSVRPGDYDPGYDGRHDEAIEAVERILLDARDWDGVEATLISDIAYEAATKALRAAQNDWDDQSWRDEQPEVYGTDWNF